MSCDTTFANNTNRKLTQIIQYEYFESLDACDLNGEICGGLEIFWCKMNEIEKMTFFGLKSTKKLNISLKIDIQKKIVSLNRRNLSQSLLQVDTLHN